MVTFCSVSYYRLPVFVLGAVVWSERWAGSVKQTLALCRHEACRGEGKQISRVKQLGEIM